MKCRIVPLASNLGGMPQRAPPAMARCYRRHCDGSSGDGSGMERGERLACRFAFEGEKITPMNCVEG